MTDYYEIELATSRDYDYTKGDTVTLAVISSTYPDPDEIENYLKETNNKFDNLKVCYIGEIDAVDMPNVIPFVEEIIDLDSLDLGIDIEQ